MFIRYADMASFSIKFEHVFKLIKYYYAGTRSIGLSGAAMVKQQMR